MQQVTFQFRTLPEANGKYNHTIIFNMVYREPSWRSVLFWDMTLHTVAIPYRHFGTTFKGQKIWEESLLGPIHCPEPSVRNYHYMLCNTQKSANPIYFIAETWNHILRHNYKYLCISIAITTFSIRLHHKNEQADTHAQWLKLQNRNVTVPWGSTRLGT
jgi:hypothetical protein